MIDVQKLRALTMESIQRAEAERAARLQAEERARRAEEERSRREAELKAERILSQVPERCGLEARAGRSFAILMSLKSGTDYNMTHRDTSDLCPRDLIGAGKIVYDNLMAANLSVTLEFWHDGVGVQSGYNLVVHW